MGEKRTFPELSPHAFEHPVDRTALVALRKVPGLDWVVRRFAGTIGERRLRLLFLASAVRVSDKQLPRVHRALLEACRVLDVGEPPELFVSNDPALNATTIGVDKPFIVLSAPLLETLSDAELECVIGHELGHVLCGHALYTTVLMVMMRMWQLFLGVPGGVYAVIAVTLGLLEWSRKAELSADRAGLLAVQDARVAYELEMKLAAGRAADGLSLEEFERQADEYRAGGDLLDGVLKLVLLAPQTHPFPVLRLAELKAWVGEGGYQRIVGGEYVKRGEAPPVLEAARDGAGSYKDAFAASKDPLVNTLKELAGGASAAGAEAIEALRSFFGSKDGRS